MMTIFISFPKLIPILQLFLTHHFQSFSSSNHLIRWFLNYFFLINSYKLIFFACWQPPNQQYSNIQLILVCHIIADLLILKWASIWLHPNLFLVLMLLTSSEQFLRPDLLFLKFLWLFLDWYPFLLFLKYWWILKSGPLLISIFNQIKIP